MKLKGVIRWLVFFLVWGALVEAGIAGLVIADALDVWTWGAAVFGAFLVDLLGWKIVDMQVGTELMDGDEREYVNAAWHASVFGVLLILMEAIAEFPKLRHLEFQLIFEDFLLGASALCMLAEEVRLLKAAVTAANFSKVGPGFDRIIVPKE